MAEWSKALVLGTSPKGRGFESHRCQHSFAVAFEVDKISLETPGIEPGASRMRSERSTTELHPLRHTECLVRVTALVITHGKVGRVV